MRAIRTQHGTIQRGRTGFTIAECLIVLAISAILMTAIATAFNASAMNYRENEEIFRTINNARQALARMTTQLRTGRFVDPNAPSNQCSFFTADNQDITFDYRALEGTLYLITNADNQEYVLCENVTGMSFTRMLTDDGSDCKSVQISITVQAGDAQRSLASAAVIRRNL